MPNTNEDYLRLFFALPDLLGLARKQDAARLYRLQDELREKYREEQLDFRWSMPVRSYGTCRQCEEKFTQVIYRLESPRLGMEVGTHESHIHAVEKHGAAMDAKLKQFLILTERA